MKCFYCKENLIFSETLFFDNSVVCSNCSMSQPDPIKIGQVRQLIKDITIDHQIIKKSGDTIVITKIKNNWVETSDKFIRELPIKYILEKTRISENPNENNKKIDFSI